MDGETLSVLAREEGVSTTTIRDKILRRLIGVERFLPMSHPLKGGLIDITGMRAYADDLREAMALMESDKSLAEIFREINPGATRGTCLCMMLSMREVDIVRAQVEAEGLYLNEKGYPSDEAFDRLVDMYAGGKTPPSPLPIGKKSKRESDLINIGAALAEVAKEYDGSQDPEEDDNDFGPGM
jgi:hypothetical protein